MFLVLYVWWFCTHMNFVIQSAGSPDRSPKRATTLGDVKGPFLSPCVTERHASPLRHQNSRLFRLWVPKASPAGFPNFLFWTGPQYWFSELQGYDLAVGVLASVITRPTFSNVYFPSSSFFSCLFYTTSNYLKDYFAKVFRPPSRLDFPRGRKP